MISRIWCRLFHRGILNLNSLTYECAHCGRLTYHGLATSHPAYRSWSKPQPKTRRRAKVQPIRKQEVA